MPAKRIIPCLDVRDGRVVKGTRFVGLRDAGDPVERAADYCAQGADEIVVLDVTATLETRLPALALIERIATRIDVPLTVGGGVRSIEDIERLLRAGADKVAVNSAAVDDPGLLARAAQRFGSQSIVIAVDALSDGEGTYRVRTRSATAATALDAVAWSARAVAYGAGEVLLTSIDRDGTLEGYDTALVAAVTRAVDVPVIASGGASDANSLAAVLEAGADAALAASIFHEGRASVGDVKRACVQRSLEMRL
jgi:imidazoleglycerol phosphate synthase cyclase subunit